LSTTNPTTFENENVKVSLQREPGCRVRLEVQVSAQATQASHHQAMKNINKEVSIPGFRKGKAPEAMIQKNFGKHVEKEWRDILLNTSFDESLRLTKIYPFNKNSVKSASIKSASLQDGSVLLYTYEESPHVPQVAFEELSIQHVARPEVKDQDITNAIEDLRLQKAEWIDVTDRPVREGDFVDIDVDIISEPARNICTQSRFAVAPGKMDRWMRNLLIGKTAGETVEGMTEKEDNHEECQECTDGTHTHEHKHDEFLPQQCRIMLHAIKEAKLMPLDDEFAKTYGAENLADFTEKVTQTLHRRAEEFQQHNQRALMEQALLTKYPFDIPHSFVEGQINQHRKGIIDSLRSGGTEESSIAEEAKKIEQNLTNKINRDMRLYFLTQRIAHDNHIAVSQDEVVGEWMRRMWMQQMGQGDANLPSDEKEAQAQVHLQLQTLKALDFLIEKTHQTQS